MNAITVSVIAPTRHLQDFVAQDPPTLHYTAAQRLLDDHEYRRFYAEESERGARIIVDNGVFELGQSLDATDLVRAANAVHATEIVLPDVIQDGAGTVRASADAALHLARLTSDFRLCVVVQGASNDDWRRCYDHFVAAPYVQTIALPAPLKTSRHTGVAYNRIEATRYLNDRRLVREDRVYRLLGLGDSGHLELAEQRQHTWIHSVDCSSPVTMGALGIAIAAGSPYTKTAVRVDELAEIPDTRHGLVYHNIAILREAAGCSLRPVRETSPW